MSFPVAHSRGRMPVTGTTPAEPARGARPRAVRRHNAGVVHATPPPPRRPADSATNSCAMSHRAAPTRSRGRARRPLPPTARGGATTRHNSGRTARGARIRAVRRHNAGVVHATPPPAPPSGRTARRTPAPCPTAPPRPQASPAIPPPGCPRPRHAPGTTPAEAAHGARLRAVRRHIAGVVRATARAGDRGGRHSALGKYAPRRHPPSDTADADRTGRLHAPHNGRRLR